jgi:3-oxo-5-alpha-steroid 4-dehydrogenase 1
MIYTPFEYFVIAWMALGILIFPILLKITAPYGRHFNKKWGPIINNRAGWIIMESPALLAFGYFFLNSQMNKNPIVWIFFSFWIIHYIHRVLIFPLNIKTKGKKMPVVIMSMAIFFNLVNGYINGYYLGSIFTISGNYNYLILRVVIGALIFLTGLYINWHSDYYLLNLRKPGETDYKIPQKFMFKFVSCPNYFGEIIEWLGFVIMTWSLPAVAFLIWTAVNLIPRALSHHKWYKQYFADYPANRKAIFPFIL